MKIFVSYAHVDTYIVKSQVVELLQTAGHEVWFDHKLLPGQDWKKELFDAIHTCDTFLYAMTSDSIESEWCRWEFALATSAGKSVIPVLLRKTSLPDDLKSIQYVDFTEGPSPNAVAKLIGGLQTLTSNYKAKSVLDPTGVPAQAVDIIERLTRKSRLLPLFDIAFNGLSLNDVVPFDNSISGLNSPIFLTEPEQYKSEFITQLNTVKICSKQVFEDDEHKKMLRVIRDIEDAISKYDEQGFTDILLYMVDRAEQLIRGLQATLSGKSLAAFTAGAILAEWTTPLNDEEGSRHHREPTQFFQVIQALTADVETVEALKQSIILVSKEKHPQTSNSFRVLFSKLREILIQNDMHIP